MKYPWTIVINTDMFDQVLENMCNLSGDSAVNYIEDYYEIWTIIGAVACRIGAWLCFH